MPGFGLELGSGGGAEHLVRVRGRGRGRVRVRVRREAPWQVVLPTLTLLIAPYL